MTRPALLDLSGVTRNFGGIEAVRSLDLAVPEGRIVGLIGPNGAGKTTVFNLITGVSPLTAGTIVFAGAPLAELRPHAVTRRGIARTFQNLRLFGSMTVWEHVLVAQAHAASRLAGVLPAAWTGRRAWADAEAILEATGLGGVRSQKATALSYGQQRRVEIARALATRPRLLLLDEPVAGMNAREADSVRALLLELNRNGLTILLIEHDMPFVMGLCDHLYVLDFGALIAEGPPADVRTNPAVLEAYLGEAHPAREGQAADAGHPRASDQLRPDPGC